jgi:hypothetical protein
MHGVRGLHTVQLERRLRVVEGKGKYGSLMSEIRQEQAAQPPPVLLPEKRPALTGKRSAAGWKQKSVLLREESVGRAQERLRRRGDKTDFSDLMQAILDAWLAAPE